MGKVLSTLLATSFLFATLTVVQASEPTTKVSWWKDKETTSPSNNKEKVKKEDKMEKKGATPATPATPPVKGSGTGATPATPATPAVPPSK